MKPKLVKRPVRTLALSLSMWCVYFAGFLEILPYFFPYLADYLPRWASLIALVASPVGRILDQGNLHADD